MVANTISGNARRVSARSYYLGAGSRAGSGKDVQAPAGCRRFDPDQLAQPLREAGVCLKSRKLQRSAARCADQSFRRARRRSRWPRRTCPSHRPLWKGPIVSRPSGRVVGLVRRAHVKGMGAVKPYVRPVAPPSCARWQCSRAGRRTSRASVARFCRAMAWREASGEGPVSSGSARQPVRVAARGARVLRFRASRTGWT